MALSGYLAINKKKKRVKRIKQRNSSDIDLGTRNVPVFPPNESYCLTTASRSRTLHAMIFLQMPRQVRLPRELALAALDGAGDRLAGFGMHRCLVSCEVTRLRPAETATFLFALVWACVEFDMFAVRGVG
jgi:hypothetical protein